MARVLTRRRFVIGAAGAAAASLLAGCESRPVMSFLGAMKSWNEKFEGFVFSPNRLAPELPPNRLAPELPPPAQTPENAFPAYFISGAMPSVPANWTLKVGGLVEHPAVLTLDQLQRMPRTDMRVQHHCVEGWSAVASWHGVRLSEIAKAAGLDSRVRYVEFRSGGYWENQGYDWFAGV